MLKALNWCMDEEQFYKVRKTIQSSPFMEHEVNIINNNEDENQMDFKKPYDPLVHRQEVLI